MWKSESLVSDLRERALKILSFLADHVDSSTRKILSSSLELQLSEIMLKSCANLNVISSALFRLTTPDLKEALATSLLEKFSIFLQNSLVDNDSRIPMNTLETCLFAMGSVVFESGVVPSDSILVLSSTILTSPDKAFSLQIRAHSLVTLGKCCVVSEFYAKKFINLFIDQLRNSEFSSLRNNVVLILGDICRIHTSVVDQHVSSLSLPLMDQEALVRKHTLFTLIQLLQEDFIKFKGSLIFRVVSRVADHDTEIAQLAFSCIRDVLPMKNPGTFANLLLDAIFFLSACVDHKAFNQLPSKIVDRSFRLCWEHRTVIRE